jgi:2-furoyl-CoA dehydrogenase large subunit
MLRSRRLHWSFRESFRFPRWSCTPVECYGVVCDWNAAEGSLTAWANFQGPFHAALRRGRPRSGLPGSKLRLITPPDSVGRSGSSRPYSPTSSSWGSPRASSSTRPVDGGSARAPRSELVGDRPLDPRRGGFSADGELLALRYDAIEDVGRVRPRTRAGHALPHARVAQRRLPRADVAARNRVVLTNTMPSGLNRGFGGPSCT